MPRFTHSGFEFEFIDEGDGDPIVLVHGFASNHVVNWVSTGWVRWLTDAGYRVIALDNRGHGQSSKSHDPADYHPDLMASDAIALLDHLGIDRSHFMGYSMGARITASISLAESGRAGAIIFGGRASGMVVDPGDWHAISDALLADDPALITDPQGRAFRKFADQTKSDRVALAACVQSSRTPLTWEEVARIALPTLVAVGTRDDIAGNVAPMLERLPRGTGFAIEGRDHMLAVGDKTFKKRVAEFLGENSL